MPVTERSHPVVVLRGPNSTSPPWRRARFVTGGSGAPRFGYGHLLEVMTVGIFEVEAASAPTGIDSAVFVPVGLAAVWNTQGSHSLKDLVELDVADVKRVVMTLSEPGIHPRAAPGLRLIREGEGE